MKQVFKPYRLINQLELTKLQKKLELALENWNNTHAMLPLTCRLGLGPTTLDPHRANTQTTRLSLIKHSLFGDQSSCFDAHAEELLAELLTQWFGSQSPEPQKDWFYIGTPSLTLTLLCAEHHAIFYLNPQWVLNNLPSEETVKKPVATLHHALAKQHIDLTVELTPLALKLADLVRLNVGDLITTDHALTKPAYLSHHQQHVCDVEMGELNSFKTIKTTRIT